MAATNIKSITIPGSNLTVDLKEFAKQEDINNIDGQIQKKVDVAYNKSKKYTDEIYDNVMNYGFITGDISHIMVMTQEEYDQQVYHDNSVLYLITEE